MAFVFFGVAAAIAAGAVTLCVSSWTRSVRWVTILPPCDVKQQTSFAAVSTMHRPDYVHPQNRPRETVLADENQVLDLEVSSVDDVMPCAYGVRGQKEGNADDIDVTNVSNMWLVNTWYTLNKSRMDVLRTKQAKGGAPNTISARIGDIVKSDDFGDDDRDFDFDSRALRSRVDYDAKVATGPVLDVDHGPGSLAYLHSLLRRHDNSNESMTAVGGESSNPRQSGISWTITEAPPHELLDALDYPYDGTIDVPSRASVNRSPTKRLPPDCSPPDCDIEFNFDDPVKQVGAARVDPADFGEKQQQPQHDEPRNAASSAPTRPREVMCISLVENSIIEPVAALSHELRCAILAALCVAVFIACVILVGILPGKGLCAPVSVTNLCVTYAFDAIIAQSLLSTVGVALSVNSRFSDAHGATLLWHVE